MKNQTKKLEMAITYALSRGKTPFDLAVDVYSTLSAEEFDEFSLKIASLRRIANLNPKPWDPSMPISHASES